MKREDQLPETRRGPPDETFEPYEETQRIPLPVLWIAIALALWGALTLYDNGQAARIGKVERRERNEDLPQHSILTGAALFEARCSTCHQPNGSGIENAVPPLDGSPFVRAQSEVIVQILLHGIQGPIAVGGKSYDGNMPNFSSVMSDEEIARVATFVRGAWSNRAGPVSPEFVAEQRRRFTGQSRSWRGGAELLAATGVSHVEPQPASTPTASLADDNAMNLVGTDEGGGPWSCASCHGANGQGSLTVPRLAGLDQGYIAKQLRAYANGARRDEIMTIVAGTLSQDEMRRQARYYAALRAPSTARPDLGGDIDRGERLALYGDWSKNVPACFSCHGSSGFGVGAEFPTLAAQHPAYTVAQLNAWAAGRRKNSPLGLMQDISKRLSQADRKAVADYLATLPPVPVRPTQKGRK